MTRICITGGPKTGKTTLAAQLASGAIPFVPDPNAGPYCDPGPSDVPVLHTDDLIHLGWSEASERVAKCSLTQPGPWIIEGVAVSRALRKWRDAHPGEPPPVDRVIRLTTPHIALSKGQATMAKGEETVWSEILPWLLMAGVRIMLQTELVCEHPGYDAVVKL